MGNDIDIVDELFECDEATALTNRAAREIERLRSLLSKHAECETMINQELKDVRAKLAVFQEG